LVDLQLNVPQCRALRPASTLEGATHAERSVCSKPYPRRNSDLDPAKVYTWGLTTPLCSIDCSHMSLLNRLPTTPFQK
jgi:hypothetical protein